MTEQSILDREFSAGFRAGIAMAVKELGDWALGMRSAASGGDGSEPHWFAADQLDKIAAHLSNAEPPSRKLSGISRFRAIAGNCDK